MTFLYFGKKYLNNVEFNIIMLLAKDKQGENINGTNKKYFF